MGQVFLWMKNLVLKVMIENMFWAGSIKAIN